MKGRQQLAAIWPSLPDIQANFIASWNNVIAHPFYTNIKDKKFLFDAGIFTKADMQLLKKRFPAASTGNGGHVDIRDFQEYDHALKQAVLQQQLAGQS